MTKYQIIGIDSAHDTYEYANAIARLAEKVNAALAEGWKLQGGVAIAIHSDTDTLFLAQAVARKK